MDPAGVSAPRVGLAAIDADGSWIGGRYYLHHLVRSVASLQPRPVRMLDIYWDAPPANDPFAEVRPLLDGQRVLRMPRTFGARARRKVRRLVTRNRTASDLFDAAGIDVVFPVPLVENQGTPLLYWLADLQFRHMPELYPAQVLARMEYEAVTWSAAAARIVASSQCAADDIARFLPHVAPKVDIVRFCSIPDDDWWALDPAAVSARQGLPERFFALPNQFTANKNHLVVVEALRILRDRGVRVTVVATGSTYDFRAHGRRPYHELVMERVRELGLESQFVSPGLIPRGEYVALLRRSVAMLQPSRFEGWSTIIEDAKTLGKPIIASGIGVHREQLGPQHRLYADVDDAERWAELMGELEGSLPAGPSLSEEAAGLQRLATARRACGEAFAGAARNALGEKTKRAPFDGRPSGLGVTT